jgi:hypothetical protein
MKKKQGKRKDKTESGPGSQGDFEPAKVLAFPGVEKEETKEQSTIAQELDDADLIESIKAAKNIRKSGGIAGIKAIELLVKLREELNPAQVKRVKVSFAAQAETAG